MSPAARLAITTLVQFVINMIVIPHLVERFGGSVPGQVMTAIARRITQIVEEGTYGDHAQLRLLALVAADEAIRAVEEAQS